MVARLRMRRVREWRTIVIRFLQSRTWMESDYRALHRVGCAGSWRRISRSLLRAQPPSDSRDGLSDRQNLFEVAHVAKQPVRVPVVVSHALCRARRGARQDAVAALRRHQLSREHLGEWPAA